MKTGSSPFGIILPAGVSEKRPSARSTSATLPPYSDQQYNGRALIDGFLPHVEKDADAFDAFSNGGLFRFLNDATVKGYGYYCRQIDFNRKNLFSRNYGDYFAGRMVFPIYDADARPTGLVGRRPGDRGVRWLKHQTREVPLSARCWLYGIDKARHYIRHYKTIILVEGIFDYFAFTTCSRPGQTGGGVHIGFLSHPRGGGHSQGP
jgi:DNA primase